MNTQCIDLDLNKRSGNQHIVIAQGDAAGTTIVATIYDGGTKLAETGVTAQFLIELPDGKHYIRDDATYSNGVITYVCDEAYVASVAGYTDNAYFELHKGAVIASTERFSIKVEPCAYDGLDVGETYDTLIDEALGDMADAITAAGTATTAASDAATAANGAASSANDAADAANRAAAAYTGAVRYYFDTVTIDGVQTFALMDAGPAQS